MINIGYNDANDYDDDYNDNDYNISAINDTNTKLYIVNN